MEIRRSQASYTLMTPVTGADTASLVLSARTGDAQAFDLLMSRYRDAVYGVAYHRLGDLAAAEDVVQETFVTAYLRLGDLREPGKFAAWLLRIAANLCGQYTRRQRDSATESAPEPATRSAEAAVLDRDVVHRALSALPQENGLVLALFYVNGYSYAEIASMVDAPTTTVKGRIERGRRQMREEMVAMMRDSLVEHRPGDEVNRQVLHRISAQSVWSLPAEQQGEHLCRQFVVIDGDLTELRMSHLVGGTALQARAAIYADGEAPISVYESLGSPGRYYVFGRARLGQGGPVAENQIIQTTMSVSVLEAGAGTVTPWEPPQVSSAEVFAMSSDERTAFFRSLRSNALINLDGGVAKAVLTGGGPGSGCSIPGSGVHFQNAADTSLHVYRWEWPEARCYVFGEADVTPPGIRVKDEIVILEARVLPRPR